MFRCVRDAEDTVACLEGLAKFFFRAGSVPLAKLDCLAAKVTLIVKAKHPDMNKGKRSFQCVVSFFCLFQLPTTTKGLRYVRCVCRIIRTNTRCYSPCC